MTSSVVDAPHHTDNTSSAWLDRAVELAERRLVPDILLRAAIRRLCRQRLSETGSVNELVEDVAHTAFMEAMAAGPIAHLPEAANAQHYELPPQFFCAVLGAHRKYSACMWDAGVQTLDDAESRSLNLTCQRARIEDGMSILELGCGWGSLTLWMAKAYPNAKITAVSNSAAQRVFIENELRKQGCANVRVSTADMNAFKPDVPDRGFDRVVSVEMFEHMRNWPRLLNRIACWLQPEGLLFIHIFCHRKRKYLFDGQGAGNWMGRHFFTGGMMPSFDLLQDCKCDLHVTERHWIDGTHYAKTAEAWLANMDARRAQVMPILRETYGHTHARRWYQRWRMFFMSCAELFAFQGGVEWGIGHFTLARHCES